MLSRHTHGGAVQVAACWLAAWFSITTGSLTTAAVTDEVSGNAYPHYQPMPVDFPTGAPYVSAAGDIAIVGYNDMQEMLTELDRLFVTTHPGFRFSLNLKGTKTAAPALTRGLSAFAPMGAEFTEMEMAAYRKAVGTDPLLFHVAHDSTTDRALSGPLAIVVHKSNPLQRLTMEQLARIFTERASADGVTQWKQLGLSGEWAGRALHPVGLKSDAALALFLQKHHFAGRPYTKALRGVAQSAEVMQLVADDPVAIGFAGVNRATPDINVIAIAANARSPAYRPVPEDVIAGRYPLDRQLLIYVRRLPNQPIDPFAAEYLRLILSAEGQHAIASGTLGYLPLNAQEVRAERAKLR